MIFDHAVKAIEPLVFNVGYSRGYVSLCAIHAVRLPLTDWQERRGVERVQCALSKTWISQTNENVQRTSSNMARLSVTK